MLRALVVARLLCAGVDDAAADGEDATDGDSVVVRPAPDVSGAMETAPVDWSAGTLSVPAAAASGDPGAGGVKLPATVGALAPAGPNHTTSYAWPCCGAAGTRARPLLESWPLAQPLAIGPSSKVHVPSGARLPATAGPVVS